MALAITTEQEHLADAVAQFAARHAPIDKTRAALRLRSRPANYRSGGRNSPRTASTRCTFPRTSGGQGGTLADMACVIEAAAAALLPGPLLSTATAERRGEPGRCVSRATAG